MAEEAPKAGESHALTTAGPRWSTFQEDPGPRMVVHWLQADGHRGYGSPLPAAAAATMLAVHRRRHPERRYWLEELR